MLESWLNPPHPPLSLSLSSRSPLIVYLSFSLPIYLFTYFIYFSISPIHLFYFFFIALSLSLPLLHIQSVSFSLALSFFLRILFLNNLSQQISKSVNVDNCLHFPFLNLLPGKNSKQIYNFSFSSGKHQNPHTILLYVLRCLFSFIHSF